MGCAERTEREGNRCTHINIHMVIITNFRIFDFLASIVASFVLHVALEAHFPISPRHAVGAREGRRSIEGSLEGRVWYVTIAPSSICALLFLT